MQNVDLHIYIYLVSNININSFLMFHHQLFLLLSVLSRDICLLLGLQSRNLFGDILTVEKCTSVLGTWQLMVMPFLQEHSTIKSQPNSVHSVLPVAS